MSTNLSSSPRQQLIIEQQQQTVDRIIDNTKENIHKVTDEQIIQNSRSIDAIKDVQDKSAQALRDILDGTLEVQKELTKALEYIWSSQEETGYNTGWTKWASPKGMAETYSKMVSTYADNTITMNRAMRDILIANMRTCITLSTQQASNYAKGLSKIGSNMQKIFKP
jgi:hypothetical protein